MAFFVFVTIIVNGFYLVADLARLVGDVRTVVREVPYITAHMTFYLMDHVAWLVVRCTGIYAGVRLWRIAPGAVESAKRFLVLVGLVAFFQFAGLGLLWWAGRSAAIPAAPGATDGSFEFVLNFARSGFYSLLWYSYFLKSVRVQNTYPNVVPSPTSQGVVS